MRDVLEKEILKWLEAGAIYAIADIQWVSSVHMVPKKSRITIEVNDKGEEIYKRLTSRWRVCIDGGKLNKDTRKDHYPLPFIDQILEKLSGQIFFLFSRWLFKIQSSEYSF